MAATTPKRSRCLSRDRHRAVAAGRDGEQRVRFALGSDRIGAHQERYDLGDDMILKSPPQTVHPEGMNRVDPVRPIVHSVRGRDDGRGDLAHAHHPVECFQVERVQKVVLVDDGAVQEQDEGVGDGGVVPRRQVDVEIARSPQDGRPDPPVGAMVLGKVDDPTMQLAVEAIGVDPIANLCLRRGGGRGDQQKSRYDASHEPSFGSAARPSVLFTELSGEQAGTR